MGMIFGILGGITGMMAAQQQSEAAQAQAQAERQAAEYNATILRNNAQSENDATTAQMNQQRYKNDIIAGQGQAAAAQSGSGMDGSNLDILRQNAIQGELDILNIRHAGQGRANNLLAQANLQDYSGQVANMRGQQAKQAGKIGMLSAMLGGLNTAFSSGSTGGSIPSIY